VARAPLHFVLDQNFPVAPLGMRWPASLRLSRLRDVDPTLVGGHEDWEILYTLNRRGDVDGFVTNDADMLDPAREMVVLHDSRLVLIVTDGVGHDPIRATGLLMVHLPTIVRRITGRPEVFVLRPGPLQPLTPGQQIDKLARRARVQANQLISRERAAVRTALGGGSA
jgi:hypothetical protein